MPIAKLQAETARATGVYTWATKPPAAGNAGLKIIISDLNDSEWRSDGSYWRPVTGSQIIYAADLSLYSSTSTTEELVSGYSSPIFPWHDLMRVPKFNLITRLYANRTSNQNTQGIIVRTQWMWPNDDNGLVVANPIAHMAGVIYGYGEVSWLDGINYLGTVGTMMAASGISLRTTYPISNITAGSAITLSARTGGAGETINYGSICVEYRA